MDLRGLRNRWYGETIYVIGSGATLNHLDPQFFTNKRCVTVNYIGQVFGVSEHIAFSHYHADALSVSATAVVVTPRREHGVGDEWQGVQPSNVILFDALSGPPGHNFDPPNTPFSDNTLMIGSSSIHGSMHLAAYLGAGHIVLVGADCGRLDDQHRFAAYEQHGAEQWVTYERDLRNMKAWIKTVYNIPVYSLNPFVNPNLEGHKYRGATEIN